MPLRLTSLAQLTGLSSTTSKRAGSKYGNRKTELDGLTFDSAAEARRHAELLLLARVGQIRDLRRQVRYELLPPVHFPGIHRKTPGLDYVADFVYVDVKTGKEVIEDVKGVETQIFRAKRHMMKALLGLDITLSR